MEEAKTTPPEPEMDMKEAIEATSDFVMPEKGEKIKGSIIAITDSAVLVDCGSKSEAILDPRELDGQSVGDEIEAVVLETEPSLKVSIKLVSSKDTLNDFQNAFQNEIPVNGKIIKEIKGGFDVEVAGKRAFLPLRHLDVNFVQDTSGYIGESYDFKIIELNPESNKFVVSRAELLKKEREASAEEAWQRIEAGATLSGKVSSIQEFGAFVDLGGMDGLVHISELSQGYINHPSELLQVGQDVQVKVIKADRAKNRISLSMKELAPDPWENIDEKYAAGNSFTGTIVRKADFGLFIELEPGIDGLLHLSQLEFDTELNDPRYDIGQQLTGWIRNVDLENKRVSLTLRESAIKNIWENLPEKYAVDSIVDGTVEEVTKYGVFVQLEPGLTGLMPLSELRKLGFRNPEETFPAHSEVQVKITSLDSSRQRISLLPEGLTPPDLPEEDFDADKPRPKRQRAEGRNRRSKQENRDKNGSVTPFGAKLAAALKDKDDE